MSTKPSDYAHYIEIPKEGFQKPVNYVMTKKGCFEIRETRLGLVRRKVEEIEGLQTELEEGIELYVPKLPGWVLTTILDFFRAVYYHKSGAEAFVQIFYHLEEEKFFLFCPRQRVSRAHVHFERDPELEEKHILVMDIHSHNSMSAFFSGIDDADEKEDRLYGVIGHVNQPIPDLKFRMGMAGRFVNLDGRSLFGPAEAAQPWPQEWLELCCHSYTPRHQNWQSKDSKVGSSLYGEDSENPKSLSQTSGAQEHYGRQAHRDDWGDDWNTIFSETNTHNPF